MLICNGISIPLENVFAQDMALRHLYACTKCPVCVWEGENWLGHLPLQLFYKHGRAHRDPYWAALAGIQGQNVQCHQPPALLIYLGKESRDHLLPCVPISLRATALVCFHILVECSKTHARQTGTLFSTFPWIIPFLSSSCTHSSLLSASPAQVYPSWLRESVNIATSVNTVLLSRIQYYNLSLLWHYSRLGPLLLEQVILTWHKTQTDPWSFLYWRHRPIFSWVWRHCEAPGSSLQSLVWSHGELMDKSECLSY